MNRFAPLLALLPALLLATAAAPAPDPLVARIITSARAVPPASLAFEETTRTVARDSAGKIETTVTVERWNGRQWSFVSLNGKPPGAKAAEAMRKSHEAGPVTGYHRLADFLAGGARRTAEANGTVQLHIAPMPKGSINIAGDRSAKFEADASVDTSGGAPMVTRLHIRAPKAFSMMLVARIDRFEIVNEYKTGPDGRPWLVRQTQDYSGAQFGSTGSVHSETVITPLR
ncbi:hypothetical protein IP88_05095 [alpha proteobacterium AAP81b]|nr:hypothetical protein IP88_05095 [alpha proteobacterium AAP81b]